MALYSAIYNTVLKAGIFNFHQGRVLTYTAHYAVY